MTDNVVDIYRARLRLRPRLWRVPLMALAYLDGAHKFTQAAKLAQTKDEHDSLLEAVHYNCVRFLEVRGHTDESMETGT